MKLQNQIGNIKALIFDMDGVVVDSEPLHLLAFQKFFEPHGIKYTEEHNREFLGRKDLVIAETLIARFNLPETPPSLVEKKEHHLLDLIKNRGVARPGLLPLLQRARELKLPTAIASSATLPTIHLVVDTLDIRQYFDALTSGDEVKHGKPAPDVFLLAAERLGVDPSDCLVIEDTLNGIRAAKAAGMWCIAIPCEATLHQDHSLADVQLKSLAEIELDEITSNSSRSKS